MKLASVFVSSCVALLHLGGVTVAESPPVVRVLVWDERQPAQKEAYDGGFLGEAIASHLAKQPGVAVRTASLESPEQGLVPAELDATDVVVWWGHVRNREVDEKRVADWRVGKGRVFYFRPGHETYPIYRQAENLRVVENAVRWLGAGVPKAAAPAPKAAAGAPSKLVLPGETFVVAERPAFVFLPTEVNRSSPQPWILYAPTLPGYPDEAERWMHESFLAAGIAVAGVDAGEAYGSPKSHPTFEALYREVIEKRGFAPKPCLLGRSRGGLWASSWAIAHPDRVAGLAGIYPVFDLRSYPKLDAAAPAYSLTREQLEARLGELNPVERLGVLAKAKVPVMLIHGDIDVVVPLDANSGELVRRYREAGAGELVKLIVLKGQGHNFFEGFFRSQEVVDFAIARARAGARNGP